MNAASVIVLALVLALAGLAAWRVFRKGAPCECGGCATPQGCCAKLNHGHCHCRANNCPHFVLHPGVPAGVAQDLARNIRL